ncbi:cyclic-phosphate processing receiver domain-containing protein [Paenibacillus daejeonensis]|uniref:cyclic-phosphate processing receiver domain-containing protein n=1 Tax=Paenibacillus daejeonensis TaxID=135193 RepID=UPI00037C6930|nr:cyclic-phosphate processing receiver domain-containing protein [Paenibacillus daejeonensis]
MIHVYLDDYRPTPTGFTAALDAASCITLINEQEIDVLSLDYDLGWGQPTGLEVVNHLVESGRYPRKIYLHTSSPSGRDQMHHLLSQHAPAHVVIHGRAMPDELLARIASEQA